MFGFSKKCPVDPYSKAWVEWRWRWLANQFGWQPMLETPVFLPRDVPCSGKSHLSSEDAQQIFDFVAQRMNVDTAAVNFLVTDEESLPANAVGLYVLCDDRPLDDNSKLNSTKATIYIADSELNSFYSTVATIAHELSHAALLGNGLLNGNELDSEFVTDLLPVYFGLGLFLANMTVDEAQWSDGYFDYSQVSKKGYLSSQTYGYAFALFAWMRGESRPEWQDQLRADSRTTMRGSMKYLQRTEDSMVTPKDLESGGRSHKELDLVRESTSASVGARLATLWQLPKEDPPESVLVRLLGDRERLVFREALDVAAQIPRLSDDLLAAVRERLDDRDRACQLQAALVLIDHNVFSQDVIDTVKFLLRRDPWRATPTKDQGAATCLPLQQSNFYYLNYSSLVACATAEVLKYDTTFIEDDCVVDSIVDAGIVYLRSEWRHGMASSKDELPMDCQLLKEMLDKVPELPHVLKDRFSLLPADEVEGLLQLAAGITDGESKAETES